MMRIETFSTEGLGEGSDLEKKMVKKDVIMPADIASYAEEIAARLEKLRKDPERGAFVLDALSDDKMRGLAGAEGLKGLTDEEIAGAMDRIRRALFESLRGKIEDKLFLVVKDLQVKSRGSDETKPDVISEVTAGRGETGVHKRQPTFEGFKRNVDDALEVFRTLPPHENVAGLVDHDPSREESLWEKKRIAPLSAYMRNERETAGTKFATGLSIVKDCMEGAAFLSANGLMLQDIHVMNLGIEKIDKGVRGVLFDFGGLVKEGDKPDRDARMSRKGYFPPTKPGAAYHQDEMTFQFGKCLEALAEWYGRSPDARLGDDALKEVGKLAKDMMSKDPRKHLTLEAAKSRLSAIIAWSRL